MSEEIKQEKFIKELKSKLTQKSHGSLKEEAVLLKAFKYFDLGNSGLCGEREFIKAIAKIGVTNYSEKDIKTFFNNFDKNNSGSLNYKELVSMIYSNKSLGYKEEMVIEKEKQIENKHPKESPEKCEEKLDTIESILDIIRQSLSSMNVQGITNLAKNFRILDENNSQSLSFEDFKKCFNEIGLNLNEDNLIKVFEAFDKDKTGEIDYDEFFLTIRGEMNEFRQNIVQKAFDKLNFNGKGELSFDEIKEKYNAKRHPDVLKGEKTEEQVVKEFMDTFQDTYNYLCGTESDNKITLEEFLEYYENVSMCFKDDEYFEVFMNNAWGIGENITYKNEDKLKPVIKEEKVESKENNQEEEIQKEKQPEQISKEKEEPNEKEELLQKIRDEIATKPSPVLTFNLLEKNFKLNSTNSNHKNELDIDDFSKSIHDSRIYPKEEEINQLFSLYDTSNTETIYYPEFLKDLKIPMNSLRTLAVKEAFSKLDEDKCGIADINDVKRRLNVNGHKDVKSGEKTEEEVYDEFSQSFQMHHDNKIGFRNKKVFIEDFIDYYTIVSMFLKDEDEFIYLLQNSWGVNPTYSKIFTDDNTKNQEEEVSFMHGDLRNKKVKTGAAAAPFGTDVMEKEERPKKKYHCPENDKEIKNIKTNEPSLLEKFRMILRKRGIRGIFSIRRAFKIYDIDDSKNIDVTEFFKFCHDYRIPLEGKEINQVFDEFDNNKSGKIDYEEFIHGIVGELTNRRKKLIKTLFESFDKNKVGVVYINEIRDAFNPKEHPDVLSGKLNEDEVLAEFLDSLKYQFSLLSNTEIDEEGQINFDEFANYFKYLSFGIIDDEKFEKIIRGIFGLEEKKTKKHGWKSIV